MHVQAVLYDRGKLSRGWQVVVLMLAILAALVLGLTMPKDHSGPRLGQGCYYSVTNIGPFNMQNEECR
jgi:hypothetical protein